MGICVVKISILLQYRRIFVQSRIQRIILVFLVLFGVWTIVSTLLLSLVCVPVAKFWELTVEGYCLDRLAIWYVLAGINLVTDFTVCIMPLPVIRHSTATEVDAWGCILSWSIVCTSFLPPSFFSPKSKPGMEVYTGPYS